MSLIRRAFSPVRRRMFSSSQGDPWTIPTNSSLGMYTTAGVQVTADTMMQLSAVYACVRILAGCISNFPLDALVTRDRIRRPIDPIPPIVADPFGGANALSGSGLTRKAGISAIVVSLLLRGNAYCAVIDRDRLGYPTRLIVLAPDMVEVDVNDAGQRTYRINNRPFPSASLLHIMGMAMPGAPVGMSVLEYAQRTIGLGLAAEEYGARFFGSGAHLSGIVEVPGDLEPKQARSLREQFQAQHGGMRNAHLVGVLTGGAKFAPVSVAPEDAQFLGTRAAQSGDIAMLFGVPPHMLGQVDRTTSWGKGIEEQTLGFLKFTVADWCRRIEDAWAAMLPDPQVARFNLDSLLRPDTSTRFASYIAARNAAIMTPNEIRALEDLPPLPDGDDLFAPLNSAHATDPGWDVGAPDTAEPTPPAQETPAHA